MGLLWGFCGAAVVLLWAAVGGPSQKWKKLPKKVEKLLKKISIPRPEANRWAAKFGLSREVFGTVI